MLSKGSGFLSQNIEQIRDNNSQNTKLKVGILGISLFLQAASCNVAAIPQIVSTYPNMTTTTIQALFTIPSFTVMLFILFSNAFIQWFGKRNTVIIGLLATLIGGVGPFFVSNFILVVISRLLVGAGIGLYTSLGVSLIGDCFSGKERKSLIGIQGAMGTLGQSSLTFVAGCLLGISWRSTFLYFLFVIPVLLLFMRGYTKTIENETSVVEEKEAAEETSVSETGARISPSIWVSFVMLFLYFAAFLLEQTNSALVVSQNKLVNQNWLSAEIAIAGLIGAAFSAGYSKIFMVLKHYTPVVAVGLCALGFVLSAQADNMLVFFFALVLMMLGNLIIPYVYDVILGEVDHSISNLVISIAQIFNNLGAFASPYVIAFLSSVVNKKTAVDQMMIGAFILAVVALVFLVMALFRKKEAMKVA
jgi:MFS family permease